MFTAPGRWWRDAKIVIPVDVVPSSFPEALLRRRVLTAALGWPLTVIGTDAGKTVVPGLIAPAESKQDSDRLTITLSTSAPSLNPGALSL
jgi:hypothetical protein